MNTAKKKPADLIIAFLLAFVILTAAFINLGKGLSSWGDDFAAYLSDSIAISRNRLPEQTKINYYYHPSPMDDGVSEEGLVYPWGYSLFLTAVYEAVGFDRTDFSDIIYYKIPSMLALALTAGVLYLYFRRRLSRLFSALIVLFFSISADIFRLLNSLYSDIVFLAFAVLSLYAAERYREIDSRKTVSKTLYAVFCALVFLTAYEVRLNGFTLVLVSLLHHMIFAVSEKKLRSLREITFLLLPYILFGLFVVLGDLILLPVTHNVSDTSISIRGILSNVCHYAYRFVVYTSDLLGGIPAELAVIMFVPFAVGFFAHGFKKDFIHITALFVGTLLVLFYLPFRQGMRYTYHILPFYIYYVVMGIKTVYAFLKKKLPSKATTLLKGAAAVLTAVCLFISYGDIIASGVSNLKADRVSEKDSPYSEASIDMYGYIRENTGDDSIICFFKPRQLYLATERLSFRHAVNGHDVFEADYLLMTKYDLEKGTSCANIINDENRSRFSVLYENEELILYSIVSETE